MPSSPSAKELRSAVQAAHASLVLSETHKWVVVRCAVASGAGQRLFAANLGEAGVYWAQGTKGLSPSESSTLVGVDAAVHLRLSGQKRFQQAAAEIEACFARVSGDEELRAGLRFFGGGAFSAEDKGASACWGSFGDASFILPRFLYRDDGQAATLTLLIPREGWEATWAQAISVLEVIESFEPERDESASPVTLLTRREGVASQRWHELIAEIKAQIAAGQAEKIVAARRVTLELSRAPELEPILIRLGEQAPLCTRFALRLKERVFFGASPERLLRKRGAEVRTDALAGSIDASLPQADEILLASEKDRAEHAYVVEAIRGALAPLCEEISIPLAPELRRLRRIFHLHTPVVGRLKSGVHVFELVEALHPTPAVGGTPRREAVDFILRREPTSRGWYASPLGWVDARGDAEFVVALRSALLFERLLHVYAGAGIVRDSEAAAEWAETELKLGGILGALGLVS